MNKIKFIFLIVYFLSRLYVLGEKLNLINLGDFIIASSNIGYDGYSKAGLYDNNTTTLGLNNGYSNYPTATDGYFFKYTFTSVHYVTSYRYYITQTQSGTIKSKVIFEDNTETINQFTASGTESGWFSYNVNNMVKEIWFKPPVYNRYSVSEVEIYDNGIVPEPVTICFVLLGLISLFPYRKLAHNGL